MNREFISLEVTPAPGGVVGGPVVVEIVIKSQMIGLITIVSCNHALRGLRPVPAEVVEVPGQEVVGLGGQGRVDVSRLILV